MSLAACSRCPRSQLIALRRSPADPTRRVGLIPGPDRPGLGLNPGLGPDHPGPGRPGLGPGPAASQPYRRSR